MKCQTDGREPTFDDPMHLKQSAYVSRCAAFYAD